MNTSGGKPKPNVTVIGKPTRTPREWREITAMKLRQYEAISYQMLIKKGRGGSYGD